MVYEVKLPELGEDGGSEATISYWHFEQGDRVEQDEDLVEMSTDKAVFAVPSPVSGMIVEIVAEEGDTVQVGEVLTLIETG